MVNRFRPLLLLLILLLAAILRLTGLDWDDYHHYHPDERYITWVATTIEWPADLATAFDPTRSPLNPFYWPPDATSDGIVVLQDEPRRFAYGHVPLYLGVAATRLVEFISPALAPYLPPDWLLTRDLLNAAGLIEFRHLTAVARALTALVDVGTVALVYLIGRRLYNPAVGLVAAALLAVNVMHIQLAHFFAVDSYLTFFTVAALYQLVNGKIPNPKPQIQNPKSEIQNLQSPIFNLQLLLAAIFMGLAIGSKFSGVLLLLPLAVAIWLDGERPVRGRVLRLLAAVALVVLTFALTNPFALLDWTCPVPVPAVRFGPLTTPAFEVRSCFLENIGRQGGMVRQVVDLPFTHQYDGTLPYLYYIEMQLKWGMGPLLGLVAFAGLFWKIGLVGYGLIQNPKSKIQNPKFLIVLAWVLPFFLLTGGFHVKFMRYLQPMTPFLMLYGAALLLSLPKARWRPVLAALVFVTTSLYALSFINLYRLPHPWTAASRWVYANVEPGSFIAAEQWDDSLPTTMVINGESRRRGEYEAADLTWLTGNGSRDNLAKLERNLAILAEADYITLSSNRVYGVVSRLPEQYPFSSQYHRLLFDGRLGYEPVYVTSRGPNLFGYFLKPDTFTWPNLTPPPLVAEYVDNLPGLNWGRADESFTVYDQPLTIIFQNTGRLSAEEMEALFILPE
jgi:4-amino-4-deoxy-L-arabinose transferase-like glycosyltransferase